MGRGVDQRDATAILQCSKRVRHFNNHRKDASQLHGGNRVALKEWHPSVKKPGCLGLHEGKSVRTVGRLHPGLAGERLLKQRPKARAKLTTVTSASCTDPSTQRIKRRMYKVRMVTPEQLAALRALLSSGDPPYVDLAVCGPFGHRSSKSSGFLAWYRVPTMYSTQFSGTTHHRCLRGKLDGQSSRLAQSCLRSSRPPRWRA